MLQLTNRTPLPGSLIVLPDRHGIDTVYMVAKGTFTLGPAPRLAEAQAPVALLDEYHGEPAASSVRVPSDVSLEKPGTDVVLVGSACAPGDRPTWQMDVSLTVGPAAGTVRVFGDRAWDAGATGASIAWVSPFVRMPLVWERAFGGADETPKGPVTEQRNPVGRGFRAPDGAKPLAGLPLPNVEDPSDLISSWKSAPRPAGFAPVAPNWLPRRAFAGTYDEAWQKSRAPYLPADFDPRFLQIAPPGLTTPSHLRGGEPVDVRGVTPAGELRFQLPALRIEAIYRFDDKVETRPAALDTIIIEPDANRLMMVWRAALPCDKRALKVREVEVSLPDGLAGVAA